MGVVACQPPHGGHRHSRFVPTGGFFLFLSPILGATVPSLYNRRTHSHIPSRSSALPGRIDRVRRGKIYVGACLQVRTVHAHTHAHTHTHTHKHTWPRDYPRCFCPRFTVHKMPCDGANDGTTVLYLRTHAAWPGLDPFPSPRNSSQDPAPSVLACTAAARQASSCSVDHLRWGSNKAQTLAGMRRRWPPPPMRPPI
jgi:hypothetical protein